MEAVQGTMRRKSVTMRDIARETGVHVSTVSRALDPKARGALTSEVAERVRTVAQKLGYRPNLVASGLRTSRTMTVGVVIPDITNTLFPPILRGLESVFEPLGYASIIVNTDSLAERESRLLDVLVDRGVDGIVHAAAFRSDAKAAETIAGGLPVVTLNRRFDDPRAPAVVNDEARGIRLMLGHLHEMGHRRIAHVAGPKALSTGLQRAEAFAALSLSLGVAPPPALEQEALRFDEEEGGRCARALMAGGEPFTAILCANDRLALGAILALRDAGLRVPRDVAVTGFNDIPFLEMMTPRLTTVRIKKYEAGVIAARLLVDLMTRPESALPGETVLPVELILRDSVARIGWTEGGA